MSEELKSCPFCGCKPKAKQKRRNTKFLHGKLMYRVECLCGCTLSYEQTRDQAITTWNARAGEGVIGALIFWALMWSVLAALCFATSAYIIGGVCIFMLVIGICIILDGDMVL